MARNMESKLKLKICLINAEFIPNRSSGQAVYAEKIAKGISKSNDVTMVTAKEKGLDTTETLNELRIIRIPVTEFDPSKWISFGYRVGYFLDQLNRKENFDVIHFLDAHVAYNFKGKFVSTLHQSFNQRLKGNRGQPYYSSLRNLIQRYPYYLLARKLEKKAIDKASAFISVSEATKKEFVKNYKIPPSMITVVYNGIDTDFFKQTSYGNLKQKLRIGDDRVLLYVGFSTPRKGLETLAQALNLSVERHFKLVMIGKWERGYKEKFYKMAGRNKHRIIEVGYVPEQDMPRYYSLADVFVLPSLLEGFGFPLAEAMACGTPVISTNVGAIPEVVNRFGVIIPPQNPRLLAEAIDGALVNKQFNNKFSLDGRKWISDYFSQNAMVEKTIDFYQQFSNQNKS